MKAGYCLYEKNHSGGQWYCPKVSSEHSVVSVLHFLAGSFSWRSKEPLRSGHMDNNYEATIYKIAMYTCT